MYSVFHRTTASHQGNTALILADTKRAPPVVKAQLITAGADINAKNMVWISGHMYRVSCPSAVTSLLMVTA